MEEIKIWLMAIRPKTLTAGLIPTVVGTALAYAEGFFIQWILVTCCLLFSMSVQIAANLINDALDFQKGVDTENRLGPVRVTQKGLLSATQVFAGGFACLSLAVLFSLPLAFEGGVIASCVLASLVLFSYLYTGGPYPLSYCGLGELFVLLLFGFVGTGGAYFVQTHQLPTEVLVAGAQVGLLATLIIAINNARDIESDSLANKKTLAVRFGIKTQRGIVAFCAIFPFFLNIYWFQIGELGAAIIPFCTLPIAMVIVRNIWQHDPGVVYNKFFGLSALLHLLFGAFLSLGFLT